MESKESEKAFDRYKLIVDLLNREGDRKGLGLIQELVDKCNSYVEIISLQELNPEPDIPALETKEERKIRLDRLRRIKHEALISQLNIVNRYLRRFLEVPIGGIYSLNPATINDRKAVANWAFFLIQGLARRGLIH